MGLMKVYILHGWTYNQDKWLPLKKILEEKTKYPVEILDIPGLTGQIDRSWTIDDYVDWLYQKVQKEKTINLIGGSNGGRISMNFVIKYPKLISHLFLIDSAGVYQSSLIYRSKNFIFKLIAKMGKIFIKSQRLKIILYKMNRTNDYVLASDIMKNTLVNLITSDKQLDITQVKVPTTIIWGENDSITPLWMGKQINQKINNSKLFIIKNAHHSPQFTNTEEVAKIIIKSLSFRT